MTPIGIGSTVQYLTKEGPVAAIVVAVEPGSVNLLLFPNGAASRHIVMPGNEGTLLFDTKHVAQSWPRLMTSVAYGNEPGEWRTLEDEEKAWAHLNTAKPSLSSDDASGD